MEDRRTAIAILLCMFLFMFWFEWVMAPYKNRPPAVSSASPTPAPADTSKLPPPPPAVATGKAPPAPAAPAQSASSLLPSSNDILQAPSIRVTTSKVELTLSSLGARLTSYKLKDYPAELGKTELLDLVAVRNGAPYPLGVYVAEHSDVAVTYELSASPQPSAEGEIALSAGQEALLSFKGTLPNGSVIRKEIRFSGDSYLFSVDAIVDASLGQPWIEWSHHDAALNGNVRINHNYVTLLSNNKVNLKELTALTKEDVLLSPQQWIAFGDKYFAAALVAPSAAQPSGIIKLDNTYLTRMQGFSSAKGLLVYAGPKEQAALIRAGHQLERSVDLGWFAFVAHPLLDLLRLFNKWFGNYGLAIVLLTLVIKTAFLPLTRTSFRSMRAMQALQPEMKALRERIQDQNQLNKETMALYKKHGVNPMGGCLPMLIQFPVFLGLYNALNYSIELRHAEFALWVNDLSSPERLELFGMGVPVMILLMGLTMLIQQITTPSAADPQQKKIMLLLPLILVVSFIIFPFPSGLVLYMFVNNLISIVQQVQMKSDSARNAWAMTLAGSAVIFSACYAITLL
ncbi:MAG: membrane protein insertase YidC [Deltaproteobacteria bacterium]|nr:membrane protein insertase YidC [Deltaproteobacteria bacterium]